VEINTVLSIGGMLLILAGIILIILQVAIVLRFKGIEKSFAKTIMPGLSLIVFGVALLVIFWGE
jgi:hypothetical protein